MAIRINTSRPTSTHGTAQGEAQRLLAVIDYAFQPYNLGDLLLYLTGMLIAAEEAHAPAIDVAFIVDSARRPADPIMADLVKRESGHSLLMAALPVLQLNPRLGAIHVFDRLDDFRAFFEQNRSRYHLWPSASILEEGRYLFYEVFDAVNAYHRRCGAIPQVAFSPKLRGWTRDFLERHAAERVPVSVNLRNNPGFHSHRNSVLTAWGAFFRYCADRVPVTFIVVGAANEMDPDLRACPNVVYAKDHHSSVLQDLSLVRHSAFHIGAASGPAAMPVFGAAPYHIVHCDMLPHIALYRGALVQSSPSEVRFAFSSILQTFGTEQETAESLLHEFDRMWRHGEWSRGEARRRDELFGPRPGSRSEA